MRIIYTSFSFVFILAILGLSPEFAAAQSSACTIDHDHETEDKTEPFFLRPATSARLEGDAELPVKGYIQLLTQYSRR